MILWFGYIKHFRCRGKKYYVGSKGNISRILAMLGIYGFNSLFAFLYMQFRR